MKGKRGFFILMRGLTNNEDQNIKCSSKEVHGIKIIMFNRHLFLKIY